MKTIILFFTILMFISCNSSDDTIDNNDDTNNGFQSIEITPILISKERYFNLSYTSQQNLVFNNETDWNYFVENIWLVAPPDEADVDFNIHMVIACIDIVRPTGGYDLTIVSIIEYENDVVVDVELSGEGDMTNMPTRPYHFVKIPLTDKEIIFQ